MNNITGEPVKNSGKLLGQAATLVDDYNKQAQLLAATVLQLHDIRKELNDDVGNGTVIVSGDGWIGNALESIPMLRMHNKEFPAFTLTGKSYFDATPTKKRTFFELSDVSFCSSSQAIDLANSATSFMESEDRKGRPLGIADAVTKLTSGSHKKSEGERLADEALKFQESEKARGVTITIADAVTAVQRQRPI